ncbi:ubiquitin-associated domain-containing protein 2-like isoform X2 [Mytilus galloprovincialis]|uniref:UBA domain-containing protein n=1 Tax=Mytilus galloprovincialis TaxID=29158 RepID=A0A8B6EUZ3_MYTGA|nr:Hypothetical predicted protein [Mytilus galloprovincialis]
MGALHGTTGFYKSPSSKGLLTATLLSSFALNFPFQQYRHYFWYNPHLIVEKQQLWRIFSSKVAYLDLKDMCCCSILMYYFRIFERRYGSRKFLSYMLSTAIISTALELSVIYLLQHLQIKLQPLPSGPLCMLYPLFIPYYCEVPRVVFGHIFGIPMTGKSFHYILGLQIASTSKESILVAICGLLSGLLWKANFLKVQSFRIPTFIAKFFGCTLQKLFESSPPKDLEKPIGATREIQRQEHMEHMEQQLLWQTFQQQPQQNGWFNLNRDQNNGPGMFGNGLNNDVFDNEPDEGQELFGVRHRRHNQDDNPVEVSEDQVQHLIDMGFNEERVRNALQISNNDISSATSVLLQES